MTIPLISIPLKIYSIELNGRLTWTTMNIYRLLGFTVFILSYHKWIPVNYPHSWLSLKRKYSLCMFFCIYEWCECVYVYVHMCLKMFVCMCSSVWVCVCMCFCKCLWVCVCVYVYMFVCVHMYGVCIYVHLGECVNIWLCMYV